MKNNKTVDFKCPHCASKCITRVQSGDDLSYTCKVDKIKELWQCNTCDKYFLVSFKVIEINKLVIV
jgi:predicted RNA-binding Zn-ribbon protein involved in translation (DUF1610 family)